MRWGGLAAVVVGALCALGLPAIYFALPWWRFSLGVVSFHDDETLAVLALSLGFGGSVFLARDPSRWRVPLRATATAYAVTGLGGVAGRYMFLELYRTSHAWGEFAQLMAASLPLWITAAVALVISVSSGELDRRLVPLLVMATFWLLVLAQRAVWLPHAIPIISHLD